MIENSESAALLARWGYLAVLAGTMLEGETVVLAAGFLAHQGYFSIPLIVLCAVIGSVSSDQGIFFLARLRGKKLLAYFPKAEAKVLALSEKIRSRPAALTAFALLFRFIYGIRNIAPLFLGLSAIPTLRFVLLNLLGAVVWAVSFAYLGWFFAKTLAMLWDSLVKYELFVVSCLLGAGAAYACYRRFHAPTTSPAGRKDIV